MKYSTNSLITCILIVVIASCAGHADETESWESFGEQITADGSVPVSEAIDRFEPDSEKEFKISGTLATVCQQKGCWTTFETGDGREIRMTFKDYGFFLPTDYAGKTAVAEGLGYINVTGINELRHLAEDAGKPEDEIEAITEPKTEYMFEARGMLTR